VELAARRPGIVQERLGARQGQRNKRVRIQMSLSVWHWILVLALLLLLLGGRGKISELMSDFWQGISAFRQGISPYRRRLRARQEARGRGESIIRHIVGGRVGSPPARYAHGV
jgi:TatA/E family protein of Tat protein translocase